nr:glycoside hydrolase family 31 protein [Microlunatus antarcticus]
MEPDEWWWGGAVADGTLMPFGAAPHRRDLATNAGLVGDPTAGANQSAPLLVSSHGRYVWSDEPFTFAFDGEGGLEVEGDVALRQAQGALGGAQGAEERAQGTLGDAFRAAARDHFPASGTTPAELMFTAPQYNTWIEMPYAPTQEGVLAYAQGVLDAGFPPGLLMIDDRWSEDYGDWRFDPTRFADPAAMITQLHAWGFAVMLWVVPFVSPDSENSRTAATRGWLVREPDGRPAVREWWNGFSTVLDLTNPDAVGWLRRELDALRTTYGVDGCKLDAGDLRDYRPTDVTYAGTGPGTPTKQSEAWARLAAEYPYNELRACWKAGGQPLAQRLHDKPPTWGADGLGSLIPEVLAQGLIGHPYGCPDMVGGGELGGFLGGDPLDAELFVRWAQCSVLMPMVQFSLAPWRVLDAEHLAAVTEAVALRQRLLPELLALVEHASRAGEPVLRPLAYHHPGFEQVRDEFLLGEDLLVAPVLEPGVARQHVTFPPGRWVADDGAVVEGSAERDVPVDLSSLPWWRRAA